MTLLTLTPLTITLFNNHIINSIVNHTKENIMAHSESPLPEDMERLDDSIDNDEEENNQQAIDLDNPMLHIIDDNEDIDDSVGFSNSQAGSDAIDGLTPMYRQNIDESRIDEMLIEDSLDDSDYPNIVDIADRDAAKYSNNNDF